MTDTSHIFKPYQAFIAGQQRATDDRKSEQAIIAQKLMNAKNTADLIGSGLMYAMNNNPKGEVDPQKYDEVLDFFKNAGLPDNYIHSFRGKPQLAKPALYSTMSLTDHLTHNMKEKELNARLKQWEDQLNLQAQKFQAGKDQFAVSSDLQQQRVDMERARLKAQLDSASPKNAATGRQNMPKITQSQTDYAKFAGVMENAENVLKELHSQNKNFGSEFSQKIESMLPNAFSGADSQKYRNAARAWVNAKLRKESGAAISEGEFENEFQTFFPQYGDTPEVIEQKERLRQEVEKRFKQAAAPAFDGTDTSGWIKAVNPQTGERIFFNPQTGEQKKVD